MRVLGIDIASQDAATAACVVEATNGVVRVAEISPVNTNASLKAAASSCAWVGIDAPFGWPVPFVTAVHGWMTRRQWPDTDDEKAEPWRDRKTLRVTDAVVKQLLGHRPLSVSSDKIAYAAMRTVHLLGCMGAEPDGRGGWITADRTRVVEVYPAGTLRALDLDVSGYKRRANRAVRTGLAVRVGERWPEVELPADLGPLVESDHPFDAWIAALTAWRAACAKTVLPQPGLDVVCAEGWIHLPDEALTRGGGASVHGELAELLAPPR